MSDKRKTSRGKSSDKIILINKLRELLPNITWHYTDINKSLNNFTIVTAHNTYEITNDMGRYNIGKHIGINCDDLIDSILHKESNSYEHNTILYDPSIIRNNKAQAPAHIIQASIRY